MGRRSRVIAKRRSRSSKAASAMAASGERLSSVSPCLHSPVSPCLSADKGKQAEAASEGDKILTEPASEGGKILKHESEEEGDNILLDAASEERKILKHESEEVGDKILVEAASEEGLKHESEEEGDKILKLDSLMLESEETLEDRQGKILFLDSEEDRKILMKVKSEEGKILKLKKEYEAATEAALAAVSGYIAPTLKPAEMEPAGKKSKKVLVKTLVPPAHIAFIKAMPCPVTAPQFNLPESYLDSEEDLYIRRTFKVIHMKLRDYHQALVDQYAKFGYAVDETELTDDEDEDNMVKN